MWGQVLINVPVSILLFGFPAAALLLTRDSPAFATAVCVSAATGFIAAWIAWSFITPKWRLWALRRVEDLPGLQKAAVSALLIWPQGHFFERTEIKSRADRIAEREAWLLYYLRRLLAEWPGAPGDIREAALRLRDTLHGGSDEHTAVAAAREMHDRLTDVQERIRGSIDFSHEPALAEDLLLTSLEDYIHLRQPTR